MTKYGNPEKLFSSAKALERHGKHQNVVELHKIAVTEDHSGTQVNFGFMYARGKGVE